jgi:hypothetical protein
MVLERLNPSPKEIQVMVRIPEGVPPGQLIDIGSTYGQVPCPVGPANSEVPVNVTSQLKPPQGKFKVALLQVINSSFFYNPVMVCQWLDQVPNRSVGFFGAWCTELDNSKEWNHFAAKLASLALASLLNTPVEMLTPVFQENLGKLFMMQVRFLKEIDEANENEDEEGEEGEEDEEEEEEEDEGNDDDYEDEDDGDGDVVDQGDVDYLKAIRGANSKVE